MVDFAIEYGVVALIAWLLTRGMTPRHAAHAHRIWLMVAAMPLAWLAVTQILVPMVVVSPRPEVIAPLQDSNPNWLAYGRWVYGIGVALMAGRLLLAYADARRVRRQSAPIDGAERARLEQLAGRTLPPVLEADVTAPLTTGISHPVIVLPLEWRALAEPELQLALLHEAAHVDRRDVAWSCAVMVMETLLWWHPAVWVASSRLRWFAELSADEAAASRMPRGHYATTLLALATRWSAAPERAYAPGMAGSSIGRRIGLLLDEFEQPPSRRASRGFAFMALAVIVLGGGFVAFEVQAAQPVPELFEQPHAHPHSHDH